MASDILVKKFIKDYSDVKNKKVREKYGYLSGAVGILVNLTLFGVKFTIGTLINSIAVTADAFNNLADVASSLVTILGFKLASKPANKEHPFGYGRIEYISGLIVAFLVLLVGYEFIKDSFAKIKNPTPIGFSLISIILLLISAVLKLWLTRFLKNVGGKINSSALQSASVEAFADVVASTALAFSILISKFTSLPIDGYIGMLISIAILYAGYKLVKDTLDPLLGSAPDIELVEDIKKRLLDYEYICGVHDLLVHNYGPGRTIASIHAEVPLDSPIVKVHEIIDRAEKEISAALDIDLVIHTDPINTDDKVILNVKEELSKVLRTISAVKSFHDFRVVGEGESINLIFDVVIGADHMLTKTEELSLQKNINSQLQKLHPGYNAIITIDKDYIGV